MYPTVFEPLPPIPLSPLRLHPLDLAFPSSPARATVLFRVNHEPQDSRSIFIPHLQHPNSPYCPWPSSVRQHILPPSSPISSVASWSLCDLSDDIGSSGLEASEGASSSSHPSYRSTNTSSTSKHDSRPKLSHSISKSISRRVGLLKRKAARIRVGVPQIQSSADRPLLSPFSIARHSFTSIASAESNSLALWLAARAAEADDGFVEEEEDEGKRAAPDGHDDIKAEGMSCGHSTPLSVRGAHSVPALSPSLVTAFFDYP